MNLRVTCLEKKFKRLQIDLIKNKEKSERKEIENHNKMSELESQISTIKHDFLSFITNKDDLIGFGGFGSVIMNRKFIDLHTIFYFRLDVY